MGRLSTFIAVAMLFLLAVLCAPACRYRQPSRMEAVAQTPQLTATPPPADQKIDFKPNGALDFIDDGGFRGSSQMFESTDGVGVELIKVWRDSSEDADKVLEERLREAGRVVERTPLLDKKGLRFGDRALVYFPSPGEGGERPAVLRTDGEAFYSLESSSLRHLLLLEKELFESKPRPKEKAAPTGLRPDN